MPTLGEAQRAKKKKKAKKTKKQKRRCRDLHLHPGLASCPCNWLVRWRVDQPLSCGGTRPYPKTNRRWKTGCLNKLYSKLKSGQHDLKRQPLLAKTRYEAWVPLEILHVQTVNPWPAAVTIKDILSAFSVSQLLLSRRILSKGTFGGYSIGHWMIRVVVR